MFLKKNLSVLEKKNPRLAAAIAQAPKTGRYKLTASQRSDKAPTLLDLKINRNYYNTIDPILVAEKDIDSRNIRLANLAVFLGFGAGYQAHEYMKRYPFANILIVEKDPELLNTVFSNLLVTDLLASPQVTILGGADPVTLYSSIFDFFNTASNMSYLKSLNIIDIPQALQAEQGYYVSIIRTAKEAISNVLTLYGNDPNDSLLGIKFTLRNISTIIDSPGIKDLEGVFKGKPGVVVATGPSLNKNIALLENIYDRAVIVGADASVKVIKKYGLKPAHMVTSLERVISTSRLFEGLTEEDTKDSFLSACPVVVPETYANFPGEKIIVYRNFATFKWLDIPKGILDIGPSSANMAFKILEFLGCDPIILIGQDLAYGDDNSSHAEGFHYGSTFETKNRPDALEVEGNYKDKVYTSIYWRMFLKHYERDISTYKGTVINATEGGAKIHGTKIMSFAEAIEKYIPDTSIKPIESIRKNLKYTSVKTKRNEVRTVLDKLNHALDFCNRVAKESSEAVEMCNDYGKILSTAGQTPDEATIEKLDAILAEVVKKQVIFNEQDFYLILMHYVQSFYINACMDLNALRFANPPSLALNVNLIIKIQELFSVMGGLVEKIVEEFKVSIELLEKYKTEIEA